MAEMPGLVPIATLPQSKHKVRVRRPSLLTLIATGGFPAELAAVVWKMYEKGTSPDDITQDPQGILQMATLIEAYVPFVLVSPKVGVLTQVETDSDGVLTGTIALLDLHDTDKQFLFFYGQGLVDIPEAPRATETVSAQALQSFPEDAARADAGPAGESVRPAPVDDGRAPAEPASVGL